MLFLFFGSRFQVHQRALAGQLAARLGVCRATHAADAPRGRREQQTRAGYPCINVRKGSALTFDGHAPPGANGVRGRGCLMSHCTPFAVVFLRPIALHPSGQIVPRGFYFYFNMTILP